MSTRSPIPSLVALAALVAVPATVPAQDSVEALKRLSRNKCDFVAMSCICKWEYVDRPYTSARNYFLTKAFFDKVNKVCWSELIQFMNESPRPKRGAAPRFATDVLRSPVLEPALKAAAKQNKLVLFIAMTGG